MNERIQELAEQAIANVRFWKGCNQESYGVDEHELAKFAELIIQECASICRDRKLTPSAFTADELLEHFGVE